jgi:hypothetical protein
MIVESREECREGWIEVFYSDSFLLGLKEGKFADWQTSSISTWAAGVFDFDE